MLNFEKVRARLNRMARAKAEWSFGPGHLVYKVGGKVFAIVSEEARPRITLKCDPVLSEALRREYAAITPGYHTNKRHWISIRQDSDLPDEEVEKLMLHSYELVRARLSRAARTALGDLPATHS